MKITFVVSWESDCNNPALLTLMLSQFSDQVIYVDDSSEGIKKIIATCAETIPESVVVIATEPLRFRDDYQLGFSQGLTDLRINPASVEYININSAILCKEEEKQPFKRLSLCAQLAHDRIAHSSPLLQERIAPVRHCLVLGNVAEEDLATLAANDIEVSCYWHNQEAEPGLTSIIGFSGTPGRYTIEIVHDDAIHEELVCGAVLLNEQSLETYQKKQLAEIFKIPFSADVFRLPSGRHLLKRGIWLVRKSRAAENIVSLLSRNAIQFSFDTCTIDFSKCGLCGTCVKTCMFSANFIQPQTNKLLFDHTRCTGCGNCVTACPVLARDLHCYSNKYMESIASHTKVFQGSNGVKIIAFYCENNGYKVVNHLVKTGRTVSASYYFLPVKCGARIGTEMIPDSFLAGFDGVALLVCARDECDNLVGSLDLERRFNLYRTIMKAQGQESGRMRIFSIKENELDNVHASLEQFVDFLAELQADRSIFSTM
jgi:coenzyme F420-reducing hydrogenase delta subunit/ferredoxin